MAFINWNELPKLPKLAWIFLAAAILAVAVGLSIATIYWGPEFLLALRHLLTGPPSPK